MSVDGQAGWFVLVHVPQELLAVAEWFCTHYVIVHIVLFPCHFPRRPLDTSSISRKC